MSEIIVTPIAASTIMWKDFVHNINKHTGKSPARGIDEEGKHLTDYAKFIAALEEFRAGTQLRPVPTITTSYQALYHLFFSFIIVAPNTAILRLSELTNLSIITKSVKRQRVAYASGSLIQWRDFIITVLTNQTYEKSVRDIAGICFECFQRIGLKHIFNQYNRRQIDDGTYLLEHKP